MNSFTTVTEFIHIALSIVRVLIVRDSLLTEPMRRQVRSCVCMVQHYVDVCLSMRTGDFQHLSYFNLAFFMYSCVLNVMECVICCYSTVVLSYTLMV